MAIKIKFDAANRIEEPTVVLARRNGTKLGKVEAKAIEFTDMLNDASEMSFTVYKYLDGKKCHLWDEITDFKLLYCVEWNRWFEITVELDEEEDESIKTVFCTNLGHAELSQIMLYDTHINTEEDILRDDYTEPTIFFNEKNHDASLLHRVTTKAPHYKIAHVDSTLAKIQRTFEFNDDSILDAFQDIAEEVNCLFVLNVESDADGVMQRNINVYDLESKCVDCDYRGEFTKVCPECGSDNIREGYGEDTTIFVDSDYLAESIEFSTDTDSVKNCFKLEAGDDLMTATVRACNPNGSDYIWYISDEVKKEMPGILVDKIEEYDEEYLFYQNEYIAIGEPSDILDDYNDLVDKYRKYNEELEKIEVPVKGYPAVMNAYYDTIDFNLYLKHSMMPSVETVETDAKKEGAKLTTEALSPVAVKSLKSVSETTADNAVLSMAKLIVYPIYRVKVATSSLIKSEEEAYWEGRFDITNYYDDEDVFKTDRIRVVINDDYEEYVQQKIEKQLEKADDNREVGIVGLFKMEHDDFIKELRKYSLNRLISFHDAGEACLDILIEQDVANADRWRGEKPDLYEELFMPYFNKVGAINEEIKVREKEIEIIVGCYDSDGDLVGKGMQNILGECRDYIQENLDFERYLGEDLWLQFCAFKREDKYSNDNYISDGLNNAEMFELAREFIETASKEIYKSAERQHTIKTDLKNLLAMEKFAPIIDKFEVGNWIRVMADDNLYKLRLIEYNIDYDDLETISVEFSDVIKAGDSSSDIQSVLDQASNMATSYGSTQRQAEKGNEGNDRLIGWVNEGLSLTNVQIVSNADNQNFRLDSHGMLLREHLEVTDDYDDRQLKIINRGLYVTDDNWKNARAGIGNFVFWNPKTRKTEEAYGVIADKLVGNLILSEEVGIYNKNNSITMDENGFTLTTSADGDSPDKLFTIQKEERNADGDIVTKKLMYVDKDGYLNLSGGIKVNSNLTDIEILEDFGNPDKLNLMDSEIIQSLQIGVEGLSSKYIEIEKTVDDQGVKIEVNTSLISQVPGQIQLAVDGLSQSIEGRYYDKAYIDLLPDRIETEVIGKIDDKFVGKTTYNQDKENFQWSVDRAAETATKYMRFGYDGLEIYESSIDDNVLLSSTGIKMRKGTDIYAEYSSDSIKLGSVDTGNNVLRITPDCIDFNIGANGGATEKTYLRFVPNVGASMIESPESDLALLSRGRNMILETENGLAVLTNDGATMRDYFEDGSGASIANNTTYLAGGILLYDGGANGTSGNVNLARSLQYYSFIDICFHDNGTSGHRKYVQRVYNPSGYNGSVHEYGVHTSLSSTVCSDNATYIYTSMYDIESTRLVKTNSNHVVMYPEQNKVQYGTSMEGVYIYRVIGWR